MRRAYEVFTSSFSFLFDSEGSSLGLKGSLNTSNFVEYGDDLVSINKQWKWAGKTPSMFDSNLPEDKQYLCCDNVACLRLLKSDITLHESWLVSEPHDNEADNLYEEDPASSVETSWRTYSLTITYDRYNETARFWLRGYNQFGLPLSKDEMFEDVPEVYVGKTVTVERHPFTGFLNLTVHPCNQKEIVKLENQNFRLELVKFK
ncbi:uncharacterized protein TA03605 [Theileria annulata]|uniref:Uncharacterized protein n=1 Tax=Theileria annulata TaxID=5874 RepID=Q4UCH7_THEAN|nr:uncharacterized protein TA03605 [Theileria annulata]CAI75474.1 hypothetical protein, conserved [Theileria annulata]|eukprot:XP_954950.1 hypothetical protein, conserved [Theileria annulata]